MFWKKKSRLLNVSGLMLILVSGSSHPSSVSAKPLRSKLNYIWKLQPDYDNKHLQVCIFSSFASLPGSTRSHGDARSAGAAGIHREFLPVMTMQKSTQ